MSRFNKDTRTLLILDDDPTFGKVMSQMGKRHRMNVIFCTTIKEFVDHALKSEFSVALIDYNLPDFSGEQVAKLVEQRPVYIISSDESVANRGQTWPQEISGFISKKLNSNEIFHFLKSQHFRSHFDVAA